MKFNLFKQTIKKYRMMRKIKKINSKRLKKHYLGRFDFVKQLSPTRYIPTKACVNGYIYRDNTLFCLSLFILFL